MGKTSELSKNDILKIGVFPQTMVDGVGFKLFKSGLYADSAGRKAIKKRYLSFHCYCFYLMEPILWEIIKVEGNRLLLLSVDKLMLLPFSSKNDSDYERSSIRTFLNGPFFKKAFSTKEKSIISKSGPFGDRVFLPSKEELMNPYDLIFDKKMTDYASSPFAGRSWLTRTPGQPEWLGPMMDDCEKSETLEIVAKCYSKYGFRWSIATTTCPTGIAPAMWIEIPDGYDVSPILERRHV